MFVSQIFEECAEILGTTNSEKVFRKISQAVQTLMESGHWTHSTAEVDICTGWDCMSVTLPRGVDTPLAINVDGSPVYFRNRLFQYHVNKGGQYNPVTWAWDDRGYTATAMEILQPSQLVAVAEVENDVGKIIRVLGSNKNNLPLRSQLDNGTHVDGLLVPIHSINDFPYGTILPDENTVESREVAIDPITKFKSSTAHTLDNGQGVNIQNINGAMPVPLSNGQVLYIGVIDAVTIQLFSDQNNAVNNDYPERLQSIIGTALNGIQLKDSKPSQVQTALQFGVVPFFPINSANPVVFPSTTLPTPLKEKVTYFINMLNSTSAQIYDSFQNAQNNTNPIYLTSSSSSFPIDVRKEVVPETKLAFAIKHFYQQGDQIQTFTSGGTLPNPLIENQNYFVNVVDAFSITLHESQQDALNSTQQNPVNPIKIIDSGTGVNFTVKILNSTIKSGKTNQVTAAGLNIPTPTGSGASFTAIVTGSVNAIQITNQGAGYLTVPSVAFSAPVIPSPAPIGQQFITATGTALINTITNKLEQIIITNPGAGYTSAPTVTIAPPTAQVIVKNVISIIRNGAVCTVTTNGNHGFDNNAIVTISGASDSRYNIQAAITKLSSVTFSYVVETFAEIESITGITYQSSTSRARVTTNGSHGFPNGAQVTIIGTNIPEYNVTNQIIITTGLAANQFEFSVSGAPANWSQAGANVTCTFPVSPAAQASPPAPIQATYNPEIVQAVANASILTSIVSRFTKNSGGNGYDEPPQVLISGGGGTGAVGQAVVNNTVIPLTSITQSAGIAIATSSIPHNFNAPNSIKISGATPAIYNGLWAIVSTPSATEFTFNISPTTPNAAIAGFATGSDVVAIELVSAGSGYTQAPTVTLEPSTGVFVEFSSTGTLPVPLTAGTAYRAEAPLNTNLGIFTIKNADFSEVNVLGGGSGSFSTIISRTFGVDFTGRWIGDFTGLSSGQEIYFGSDFIFPTTSPSVDSSTPSYLNILSNSVAKAYTNPADALIGGINGLIDVISFGAGQSYYGVRLNVSALPYENLIIPDNIKYLQNQETVQFSSSFQLPSPLLPNTDYLIKLFGNGVKVYTLADAEIILTDSGAGSLSLDIIRNFTPQKSTKIICDSSLFETGQSVTVRPAANDILPNGLVSGTNYYVRRIDNNSFELYNTVYNAKATGTTGRIEFQTSGNSVDSTFFIDAIDDAVFVKNISHIEKPITDGYVSLYAWDYGRSNDMTLIGQYHPSEVNPQYRRIRIGKPCAWVRLAYRVSAPFITSMYDYIPIEHERAIIAAIHAVDMEDKDFAEQSARYWQIAFQYLKNQQEYIDGHAMTPPQINNITYGDGTDPVML